LNKRDLRGAIIPTKLNNQIPGMEYNENLDCEDMIYFESSTEVGEKPLLKHCSDFSKHMLGVVFDINPEKFRSVQFLRDFYGTEVVETQVVPLINSNGELEKVDFSIIDNMWGEECFAPAMRLDINKYLELTESKTNFITEKEIQGQVVHTLPFGDYPQTKVDEETKRKLVKAIEQKDSATAQRTPYIMVTRLPFQSVLGLVYEMDGQQYFELPSSDSEGKIEREFFKIEPVNYIIKNWDRLPKTINPEGTGQDNFFDVSCEILFPLRQFRGPYELSAECVSWINMAYRFDLNGITEQTQPFLDPEDTADYYVFMDILKEPETMDNYIFQGGSLRGLSTNLLNYVSAPKMAISYWSDYNLKGDEILEYPYFYIDKKLNRAVFSNTKPQKGDYKPVVEIGTFDKLFKNDKIKSNLIADGIISSRAILDINKNTFGANILEEDIYLIPSEYSTQNGESILQAFGARYISNQPDKGGIVFTRERPDESQISRTYHFTEKTKVLNGFDFVEEVLIDDVIFDTAGDYFYSSEVAPIINKDMKYAYASKDNPQILVVSRNKPNPEQTSPTLVIKNDFPGAAGNLESDIEKYIFEGSCNMDNASTLASKSDFFIYVDKSTDCLCWSKTIPNENEVSTTYKIPNIEEVTRERYGDKQWLFLPKLIPSRKVNLIEKVIIPSYIYELSPGCSGYYKFMFVDKETGELAISQSMPKEYSTRYTISETSLYCPRVANEIANLIEEIEFLPTFESYTSVKSENKSENTYTFQSFDIKYIYVSAETGKFIASKEKPHKSQIQDTFVCSETIRTLKPIYLDGEKLFDKIVLHDKLESLPKDAIMCYGFKNIYINNDGKLVFSSSIPDKSEYKILAKNVDLKQVFAFDNKSLNSSVEKWLERCEHPELYVKAISVSQKSKIPFPIPFLQELDQKGMLESFLNESKFKNFKQILPMIEEMFKDGPIEEITDFYRLATTIGCFSTESLLDKKGRPTADIVSRKACELVKQVLTYKKDLKPSAFHPRFSSLRVSLSPNQDLLTFLAHQENKKLLNLEMLINLENDHSNVLPAVINNFSRVKELYDNPGLDANGMPFNRSWEGAINTMFSEANFVNVTPETEYIADSYLYYGVDRQEVFDKGVSLHQKAATNKIPKHILAVELKESSEIIDDIKSIAAETQDVLRQDKQLVEGEIKKRFTYEMLAKDDPLNGIIGLAVSCCGTITSEAYGNQIATATIIAPDVQNMVIRNEKGEVISKGSMYINKDLGYAVVNDFEMSNKYRKDEMGNAGRYQDKNPEFVEARKEIFAAYERGFAAFVKEYDKENPDRPLQKIVVGMGYNRLKSFCEQFEKVQTLYSVPSIYGFDDALKSQHVLYDRQKVLAKQKEEGMKL